MREIKKEVPEKTEMQRGGGGDKEKEKKKEVERQRGKERGG